MAVLLAVCVSVSLMSTGTHSPPQGGLDNLTMQRECTGAFGLGQWPEGETVRIESHIVGEPRLDLAHDAFATAGYVLSVSPQRPC